MSEVLERARQLAARIDRRRMVAIALIMLLISVGSIYLPVVIQRIPLAIPVELTVPLIRCNPSMNTVLPVRRQPTDNPAWVTIEDDEVTLFDLALDYGSYGLVAHDYLAGSHFTDIGFGESVILGFEDGRQVSYIIIEVQEYQAVHPQSVTSDFTELLSGERMSVAKVFFRTYGIANRVILQTSIKRDNVEAWGRRFLVAIPDSLMTQPYIRLSALGDRRWCR